MEIDKDLTRYVHVWNDEYDKDNIRGKAEATGTNLKVDIFYKNKLRFLPCR